MSTATGPNKWSDAMVAHASVIYAIYGLTLVSDIRLTLPEAHAPRGDNRTVHLLTTRADDVRFPARDVELAPDEGPQQKVLADGSLYMCWKSWFDFLVSADGIRVVCRNLSESGLEHFEAYLTNFAVSAALLQQGEETLHATVVDIGGRAIGLLGASGGGKSTLASFLRGAGGDVVTDDILRITFENETALAHPGPYRLKLFPRPAELFLSDTSASGRWSPVGDKHIYDLGDPTKTRSARPLTALYHLRAPVDRNDKRVTLERLRGLDLFKTVGGSTMNNGVQSPVRVQRHFQYVKRLASVLPVYCLTYPRTFDMLPEVVENIFRSAPPRARYLLPDSK